MTEGNSVLNELTHFLSQTRLKQPTGRQIRRNQSNWFICGTNAPIIHRRHRARCQIQLNRIRIELKTHQRAVRVALKQRTSGLLAEQISKRLKERKKERKHPDRIFHCGLEPALQSQQSEGLALTNRTNIPASPSPPPPPPPPILRKQTNTAETHSNLFR